MESEPVGVIRRPYASLRVDVTADGVVLTVAGVSGDGTAILLETPEERGQFARAYAEACRRADRGPHAGPFGELAEDCKVGQMTDDDGEVLAFEVYGGARACITDGMTSRAYLATPGKRREFMGLLTETFRRADGGAPEVDRGQ